MDAGLAADIVGAAASARRRVSAAERALERLAAPDWAGQATVTAVEAGVVTVAAVDESLCGQLRSSRLGRDLMRALAGVRSVRFTVQGCEADEATEPHE